MPLPYDENLIYRVFCCIKNQYSADEGWGSAAEKTFLEFSGIGDQGGKVKP